MTEQLIVNHLSTLALAVQNKSASGRGSGKKIDLYGIKKLRELILELAVRGKLVAQNPEDEPASKLLERIEAEKAKLAKEKLIKNQKALPAIAEDEQPFEVPTGWKWVRLGDICTLENGDRSKNYPNKSLLVERGIPFVNAGHLQNSRVNQSEMTFITQERFDLLRAGKFQEGDILYCLRGSLGKSALVSGLSTGAIASSLVIVRSFEGIDQHFLLRYFDSPFAMAMIKQYDNGTAQPNLSAADLAKFLIPLSSDSEQHRIVTKVDELMALCDQIEQQTEASLSAHTTLVENLLATLTNSANAEELEKNWQRIANHFTTLFTTEASIDQLKQTILQLAVMGKLVPQDPNDEPAANLLERIDAEKAQLVKEGKIKKQKPLSPVAEDEKPFGLPDGWEWCRMPDIGELARGKSKHRPRNDPILYSEGSTPLIQTGDVSGAKHTGRVIKTHSALYNVDGVNQSRLWPAGTMCITIAANIADTGILGFDACFPDSVVGFRPYETEMDVSYFEYFIRTAKDHLEEFAPSTAQKNINLEILGTLLVPLPPLAELNSIVAKVNQLTTLCDQIKTHLQHQQQTRLHLADAMVAQALNPTNPNSTTQTKAANP
ncbi:restriction endonuclease subunit S [Endozoicomonas acroporae]|uniref:restriction endonuclease subunit S n=1 Tax=Endozoicomonas acroporae TaxID=1701104 RepID=UPI001C609033|nr:restriction endonuclease subunit S [Endozoicomonas acroporae]